MASPLRRWCVPCKQGSPRRWRLQGGEGWQAGVQLGWVTLMMCPVKREEGSSVSLRKALFVALGLDQALYPPGSRSFRGE